MGFNTYFRACHPPNFLRYAELFIWSIQWQTFTTCLTKILLLFMAHPAEFQVGSDFSDICMLRRGDWRGSWDGAEPPPTIWDQHKSWLGLNWDERNRKFWSDLNWQHRLSSPLLFVVSLNSQIFSEMKQVTWYPSWRVHLANGSTHFSTFCELFHKLFGRLHYTAQRKLQRNTWK